MKDGKVYNLLTLLIALDECGVAEMGRHNGRVLCAFRRPEQVKSKRFQALCKLISRTNLKAQLLGRLLPVPREVANMMEMS